MRLVPALLALSTLLVGACANNPDRLPQLDRRFYDNLPTPADQTLFLKLRKEERQPYLENRGLWQKWTALPEEQREAVRTGVIRVGFAEFAVFMAWGPPADTRSQKAGDREVRFHTFIRCTSGPKIGRYVRNGLDCDGTSSETLAAIENQVVTEIKFVD